MIVKLDLAPKWALLISLAVPLGMALNGEAATVSVTNSVDGQTVSGASSDGNGLLLSTSNFDMNGGNAVALLVSTEETPPSANAMTATFAGQAMTAVTAIQLSGNGAQAQRATVFYLLSPATTVGAFEITVDPNLAVVELAYSQIALDNVAGVAGSDSDISDQTGTTVPLEVSYTTTSVGGYVLGAAVNNDFNNARQLTVVGNPDMNLLGHTLVGSSGHFHTHDDVPTAGSYTDQYFGRHQRTAVATVAFDSPMQIPEPASFILLGLGLAAACGRRRH